MLVFIMNKQYRKTYVEVNLTNLLSNYNYVQDMNKSIKIIPVVKANAYGHGSIKVVEFLRENGVKFFAVSLLEEALEIRRIYSDISILIMGVLDYEGFEVCSEFNLTPTVSNHDQILDLLKMKSKLNIHVKIDTGMNRLGFKDFFEFENELNLINQNKNIHLEGVYTHFSTADSDDIYLHGQLTKFNEFIVKYGDSFEYIHVSNSSSSIKYDNSIDYTTHARLGISLYGLSLDEYNENLKNTFKLVTKISEIKTIKSGEKVGYGATYTALKDEVIGILPIGYADGFIRANQNGYVEINNKRYQIIGRICMDQMFIRIDESISKEDKVILFGGLITIDEVAKRLNTINYEVICQITSRVPKVYIK